MILKEAAFINSLGLYFYIYIKYIIIHKNRRGNFNQHFFYQIYDFEIAVYKHEKKT